MVEEAEIITAIGSLREILWWIALWLFLIAVK